MGKREIRISFLANVDADKVDDIEAEVQELGAEIIASEFPALEDVGCATVEITRSM